MYVHLKLPNYPFPLPFSLVGRVLNHWTARKSPEAIKPLEQSQKVDVQVLAWSHLSWDHFHHRVNGCLLWTCLSLGEFSMTPCQLNWTRVAELYKLPGAPLVVEGGSCLSCCATAISNPHPHSFFVGCLLG